MTTPLHQYALLGCGAALCLMLSCCGGASGPAVVDGKTVVCISTALVVCTRTGQVQGTTDGNFRVFRGIPFAAPPVGDLRWRPPAPPANWSGVRDATRFGNRCPQFDGNGAAIGNEDCLTLNIFAQNPPASAKQPVIVLIHGGGDVLGSAQEAPWGATPPLARHGVIVVTVQYRLGLLGFLAHPLLTAESPQGSSGNYGLMDLIAALKWVRDNISEFGGDPAKVMIDGHSAGSNNVQFLLASPAADGLFTAAVMESGVFPGGMIGTSVDYGYKWYADVPSAMGCDTAADVLACLRAVPADTLATSVPNHLDTGWPNIEPIVLPEDPYLKLQRLGSPVPVIVGSNSDEMSFGYVFAAALDDAGYADAVHTQFDRFGAGTGDTILSLYPSTDFTNPNYALESVESDFYYTRNIRNFARDVSGSQRSPVWRYLFTHRYENPAPQDGFLAQARAFHGAETYFLTGSFQTLGTSVTYSPSSAELALSEEMMGYWVQLVTTGDPNGASAVQWLPYDNANGDILQLDDDIATLPGGYRNAQCDFLSTLPTHGF